MLDHYFLYNNNIIKDDDEYCNLPEQVETFLQIEIILKYPISVSELAILLY